MSVDPYQQVTPGGGHYFRDLLAIIQQNPTGWSPSWVKVIAGAAGLEQTVADDLTALNAQLGSEIAALQSKLSALDANVAELDPATAQVADLITAIRGALG